MSLRLLIPRARIIGIGLPSVILAAWFGLGTVLAETEQSGWRFILVEGRYLALAGLLGMLSHRFAFSSADIDECC